MKVTVHKALIALGLSMILSLGLACGSLEETPSSTSSSSGLEVAAVAVGSLFSGTGSSALVIHQGLQNVAHPEFQDPNDPQYTCTQVLSGAQDQEHPILTAAFGEVGTYGSLNESITVIATDFCTQPDGTENEGLGSDGLGRFATFELIGEVSGDCTDEEGNPQSIAMEAGSSGIWRNTEDYYPQIYGTFTIKVGEESVVVDCTIYLDENETAVFADCSDENGESVVQETSASCNFSAE